MEKIFPFWAWFKGYSRTALHADFISGITVAFILVPQSMAYAQLAGLPVYFGLYASFLPPMIASLFGSSRQLATGPVAVVSLMTFAALEPLAPSGSDVYVGYAIMLALVIGVIQFFLGLFRLGVLVSFISHPVIIGFTNAVAIIIALSQLPKIFGIHFDSGVHIHELTSALIVESFDYIHWPTLGFTFLAFAIMGCIKWFNPRLPYMLVAMIITVLLSWGVGYQKNHKTDITMIQSKEVREKIYSLNTIRHKIGKLRKRRLLFKSKIGETAISSFELLENRHEIEKIDLQIKIWKKEAQEYQTEIQRFQFFSLERQVEQGKKELLFFLKKESSGDQKGDGKTWRLMTNIKPFDTTNLLFSCGGTVVGSVPKGLPTLSLSAMDVTSLAKLILPALLISFLGFMEAISIAKTIARKTGQRLDPNQELIGQGMANLVSSIGQGFPVSGSFSRSAINLQSGAVSGVSGIFTSLVVAITLLYLTPFLYYLPQATLAAVIIMAVLSLIDFKQIVVIWKIQKIDGIVAIATFCGTLIFANQIEIGLIIGIVLSLSYYLLNSIRPNISILSIHEDGTLRDAQKTGLKTCESICVIKFDRSLSFANTSCLENKIFDQISSKPTLNHIIILGDGIHEFDSTCDRSLNMLVDTLSRKNISISFVGLNEDVLEVMRRTSFINRIGEEHIFATYQQALQSVHEISHKMDSEKMCPLLQGCQSTKK